MHSSTVLFCPLPSASSPGLFASKAAFNSLGIVASWWGFPPKLCVCTIRPQCQSIDRSIDRPIVSVIMSAKFGQEGAASLGFVFVFEGVHLDVNAHKLCLV